MKLNSGELATDVEEDGPSEFEGTIIKLDKTLPLGKVTDDTENRTMTSLGNKSDVNGSMDQFVKRREPVEDSLSDSEENNSGSTPTPDEHDDLADALADCKLTPKASGDDSDLPEKISNLNLVEERDASGHSADDTCQDDDHECPEGYVAINGVISKEEAERRDRESAEDRIMREKGPSGGTPSNYQPNIQNYNHIAAKAFPVSVACPQFGQQQIGGYGLSPQSGYGNIMGRQQMSPTCYQPQMQNFGKRSRDDRDEEPLKYVKPVTNGFNNLSDPSKGFITCSNVVSKSRYSGGQVLVKTPEIVDTTNSGEFDFIKMLGEDFENSVTSHYPPQNILSNNNVPGYGLEQTQLDFSVLLGSENRPVDTASEGYVSDSIASPYNESQGSPGDQTVYSPPPSVDSGTGSSVAHSPASQMDISSPRSNMTGFESNLDMYNPQSNFISPSSPANLNQPVCSSHEFIPKQGYQQVFGSPIYQPPVTNVAQVQPFSTSGQTLSQFGEPSRSSSNFTDFFDENKENLKEVMEVLADDIVSNEQKKTKPIKDLPRMPQNIPVPIPEQIAPLYQQKLSQTVQVQTPKKNVPIVSVPPNQIPVSMYPTATTAVTTAPMVLVQQSPVTINQGVSMAPTLINTTVPSFSQNLGTNQILVIPSQQATPQPTTIVFVQPPPQPQSNKRVSTFIPIRPKLPSNIGKASPTSKPGPPQKSPAPQVPISRTCEVPPVPAIQPVLAQKPIAKTPKNTEKQLNIARRVVANMTKEDLQYVDSDGDTYLHVAVCRVEKFMVEALLERIVREKLQYMICKQNHEGQTPIYLAVSANQPEMVTMLIKLGGENVGVNMMAEQLAPNGQKDIRPALHSAASNGGQYLPTLQALLKSQDCNLNICNSDGYTALHCAILEHGQAVEIRDNNSQSMRLVKDSKPIIIALIKAGADPNAQDKKSGKTAFMYALETCDYNLIETLLSLIDITKIRSYFRTQAFDGSTCMKILESRKNNFPVKLYEKLTGIMSHNRNTFVCRRGEEAS